MKDIRLGDIKDIHSHFMIRKKRNNNPETHFIEVPVVKRISEKYNTLNPDYKISVRDILECSNVGFTLYSIVSTQKLETYAPLFSEIIFSEALPLLGIQDPCHNILKSISKGLHVYKGECIERTEFYRLIRENFVNNITMYEGDRLYTSSCICKALEGFYDDSFKLSKTSGRIKDPYIDNLNNTFYMQLKKAHGSNYKYKILKGLVWRWKAYNFDKRIEKILRKYIERGY